MPLKREPFFMRFNHSGVRQRFVRLFQGNATKQREGVLFSYSGFLILLKSVENTKYTFNLLRIKLIFSPLVDVS